MENDDLIQLRTQLLSHLLPEISTHLRYAMGNLHFAAAALAPLWPTPCTSRKWTP